MYDDIRSSFEESHVCAISFTDKVNLYMNACDVLITKPGGLSSTEAATANIPFVALITIPRAVKKKRGVFLFTRTVRHGAVAVTGGKGSGKPCCG